MGGHGENRRLRPNNSRCGNGFCGSPSGRKAPPTARFAPGRPLEEQSGPGDDCTRAAIARKLQPVGLARLIWGGIVPERRLPASSSHTLCVWAGPGHCTRAAIARKLQRIAGVCDEPCDCTRAAIARKLQHYLGDPGE